MMATREMLSVLLRLHLFTNPRNVREEPDPKITGYEPADLSPEKWTFRRVTERPLGGFVFETGDVFEAEQVVKIVFDGEGMPTGIALGFLSGRESATVHGYWVSSAIDDHEAIRAAERFPCPYGVVSKGDSIEITLRLYGKWEEQAS